MATGTGNLPHPSMAFTPFDILTADEMNDLVDNIESLATGSGIGDGAIGTSDLADDAVTSAKLDVVPTTDANGWSIRDYGTSKIATKRITFNQSVNAGSGTSMSSISSNNLPSGMTNITNARMSYNVSYTNGDAYNTVLNAEMATNASVLNFTAIKILGGTGTKTGFIDIVLVY